MGPFTAWRERSKCGDGLPIPPELLERMAAELLGALSKHFERKILPAFGVPMAEELAADQIAQLLDALDDAAHPLPEFVVDSRTLRIWAFRNAWWKLLADRRKTHARGLSALGRDDGGQVVPLAMQERVDDTDRGDALDPEALGVETGEALHLGLSDMQAWWRSEAGGGRGAEATEHANPDWAQIFISVILKDRRQTDVARELGLRDWEVTQWMNRGRFCIARRLGYTDDQLIAELGLADFKRFSRALAAALASRP